MERKVELQTRIICRFCLQIVDKALHLKENVISSKGEVEINLYSAVADVVPEINLSIIVDPKICYKCKDDLVVALLFRKQCFRIESQILKMTKENTSAKPLRKVSITPNRLKKISNCSSKSKPDSKMKSKITSNINNKTGVFKVDDVVEIRDESTIKDSVKKMTHSKVKEEIEKNLEDVELICLDDEQSFDKSDAYKSSKADFGLKSNDVPGTKDVVKIENNKESFDQIVDNLSESHVEKNYAIQNKNEAEFEDCVIKLEKNPLVEEGIEEIINEQSIICLGDTKNLQKILDNSSSSHMNSKEDYVMKNRKSLGKGKDEDLEKFVDDNLCKSHVSSEMNNGSNTITVDNISTSFNAPLFYVCKICHMMPIPHELAKSHILQHSSPERKNYCCKCDLRVDDVEQHLQRCDILGRLHSVDHNESVIDLTEECILSNESQIEIEETVDEKSENNNELVNFKGLRVRKFDIVSDSMNEDKSNIENVVISSDDETEKIVNETVTSRCIKKPHLKIIYVKKQNPTNIEPKERDLLKVPIPTPPLSSRSFYNEMCNISNGVKSNRIEKVLIPSLPKHEENEIFISNENEEQNKFDRVSGGNKRKSDDEKSISEGKRGRFFEESELPVLTQNKSIAFLVKRKTGRGVSVLGMCSKCRLILKVPQLREHVKNCRVSFSIKSKKRGCRMGDADEIKVNRDESQNLKTYQKRENRGMLIVNEEAIDLR